MRNSIWTLFFLAGMAFMATLIFMLRPELFSNTPIEQKPGSTVILGGASKEVADQEPVDQIPAQVEDREPVLQVNKPKPNTPVIPTPSAELPPTTQPVALRAEPELEGKTHEQASTIRSAANHVYTPTIMIQPGRRALGHVKIVGALPPPKEIPLGENYCGPTVSTTLTSRVYLRAKDDSLADVVVAVTGGAPYQRAPSSAAPAWITISHCQFQPYITAIQVGQRVGIVNLDNVLQEAMLTPPGEPWRSYTFAPPKSPPKFADFRESSMFVRIDSALRPYMVCYVCVLPNPFFAVTGSDGRFEINNLPPGNYTITAFHRKAGSISRKITVSDYESPQIEFVFEAPTEVAQRP